LAKRLNQCQTDLFWSRKWSGKRAIRQFGPCPASGLWPAWRSNDRPSSGEISAGIWQCPGTMRPPSTGPRCRSRRDKYWRRRRSFFRRAWTTL